MTRVAIIGAGPCGISQLCAFAAAKAAGADIPEIVCYEKQGDMGGLWNYTWRTGLDEYGEPVHGSMYRYLWSNGPRNAWSFPTTPSNITLAAPSLPIPPRAVLADYLRGRAGKAGARDYMRFNTVVRNVVYSDDTGRFTVTAHEVKNDKVYHEDFDYVVVANGHFSVPNAPHFEGFDTFNGRILHAHDFRDALEFKDKDLLIIGTSYSAEDIGSQCHKYGAKSITCSYRTAPMGFHWPDNWKEVPLLTGVQGNTATFKDGTTTNVDAIILCTGYLHHFPFLSDGLRLQTTNRLWPLDLYKGIIWEDNPKLIYLGMQDQFYTFNMFDAQAWYARDHILGRIPLPSLDEMREHGQAWRAREEKLADDEQMIRFQGDYVQELIDATDYPNFDVQGTNAIFMEWEHHKHEDIMCFRNNAYRSLMTGNLQPLHHTPWLEAMDDSMESYIGE